MRTKNVIVFYSSSLEDIEKDKNYESISSDKEDYYRCVARMRFREIEACIKRDFPFLYIVGKSIKIAGHGLQNISCSLQLYDRGLNPVGSLNGEKVLLRTDAFNIFGPLSYIKKIGGAPISSWEEENIIQKWYEVVLGRFLKREMKIFPCKDFLSRRLEVKECVRDGNIFIKTTCKKGIRASVINVADILECVGLSLELVGKSVDVIVSEPLSLLSDEKGKMEYRYFVVERKIANCSRYIDYDTDYDIPDGVTDFAKEFIEFHKDIFPRSYVLDVGVDKAKGPVVIELNPLSASGSYERNDFDGILKVLS